MILKKILQLFIVLLKELLKINFFKLIEKNNQKLIYIQNKSKMINYNNKFNFDPIKKIIKLFKNEFNNFKILGSKNLSKI